VKRHKRLIGFLLVVSIGLVACGGDGGGAPVEMEKEETSAFTIERPKDWQTDSMDMFGITILIASSTDVPAQSFLQGGDPTQLFSEAPGVLVMSVPQEMAEEGGDIGFSADELRDLPNEEPGVEIITDGDVTVDGVKGYRLAGKGTFETMGGSNMGVHVTVLEKDTGPLVVMGFSPDKDIDKNLEIFEYMADSIEFK
jgi:hypothetical protein